MLARGNHRGNDHVRRRKKQLHDQLDRIVRKIEEHPEAAIAAMRALANRIDILIEGGDHEQRVIDLYHAVWMLMIGFKDYAAEQDSISRRPAA